MADLDDLMGPEETAENSEETAAGESSSPFKKFTLPPNVVKIVIRVGIGLAVLGAQAGLSFFLVTKVLSPFPEDPAEIAAISEPETAADSLAVVGVTQEKRDDSSPEPSDKQVNVAVAEITSYDPLDKQVNVPMIDAGKVGSVYTLSDVVVNPALSNGRRFFIITVVMLFEEKKMEEVAQEREAILRDGFIRIMSRKSARWFTSYSNQDVLKKELIDYTIQVLDCSDKMYMAFTKYVLQ